MVDAEEHGADTHAVYFITGDQAIRSLEPSPPFQELRDSHRNLVPQNIKVRHHFPSRWKTLLNVSAGLTRNSSITSASGRSGGASMQSSKWQPGCLVSKSRMCCSHACSSPGTTWATANILVRSVILSATRHPR